MNVTPSVFLQVGSIFLSSKARREAEYSDFLSFYKSLVEQTDGAVASAVGTISVDVRVGKEKKSYGIILSPTDYLWWKQSLAENVVFEKSVEHIKSSMLIALAKAAEGNKLTAEERKALLALLDA
jgi:hypothetical protein